MANEYRFTRAQLDEVVRCAIATSREEAERLDTTVEQADDRAMAELFEGLDAEHFLEQSFPSEFHMTMQLPVSLDAYDAERFKALAAAAEDVLGSAEVGDAGVVFCSDVDIAALSTALTALPKETRDAQA